MDTWRDKLGRVPPEWTTARLHMACTGRTFEGDHAGLAAEPQGCPSSPGSQGHSQVGQSFTQIAGDTNVVPAARAGEGAGSCDTPFSGATH